MKSEILSPSDSSSALSACSTLLPSAKATPTVCPHTSCGVKLKATPMVCPHILAVQTLQRSLSWCGKLELTKQRAMIAPTGGGVSGCWCVKLEFNGWE